jgi:TraG-like protein, N-terminal region
MSNWEFVTYGGFDSLSQALTMMALIFHNPDYQGLWFGVAVIGLICAGLRVFLSGNISGFRGISWIAPSIIGITLMFAFVRTEANLQLIDYTTNQTAPFNVPLGLAAVMSTLNKIECGLVNVISSSGAVDQPSNYRRFSGGSGYDLFSKLNKSRNLNMENTLDNYITDCVVPVAGFTGFANFNIRDWKYGDTPSGLGFFDLMASGQSVLLTTIDDTAQPQTEVTCSQVWTTTLYPYYSNPATFTDDVKAVCTENGYDATNAGSLAECKSKMSIILQGMTNKTMTAETFMQMQTLSQIASSNLNSSDPDKVAVSQASKTLSTQGAGISAVFTHFAPIIRNIMWAIVIMLIPLCAIFIVTPLFGKVLSFIAGLMVLLVSWTVIDCGIHTAMMGFVSAKFSGLATMGQGTMFYAQLPSVASETLGFYGMMKGASLMLATAFSTVFGLQSSHAMTQFASGIQGSLDNAGRSAGAVAFTPEGRAQAINAQHQVGESMTNAHAFKPEQMWEKGSIMSQKAFGSAMAFKDGHQNAIKEGYMKEGSTLAEFSQKLEGRGFENQVGGNQKQDMALNEATNKGLVKQGTSITGFVKETGFQDEQSRIGGLLAQKDGLKAAKADGYLGQDTNLTDLSRSKGGVQSLSANGKVTNMGFDTNGNVVQSKSEAGYVDNKASGNKANPTQHFDTSNTGALAVNNKEGLQQTQNDSINKSKTATETAATNSTVAHSKDQSFDNSLADSIEKHETHDKAESKRVADSLRASQSKIFTNAKALGVSMGLGEKESNSFARHMTTKLSGSFSTDGIPTTPTTVAMKALGIKVAAEMGADASVADQKSLERNLSSSDSKTFTSLQNATQERAHAIEYAQTQNHGKGEKSSQNGVNSWREHYSDAKRKDDTHSDAVSNQLATTQAFSNLKNSGYEASVNQSSHILNVANDMFKNEGGGDKFVRDLGGENGEHAREVAQNEKLPQVMGVINQEYLARADKEKASILAKADTTAVNDKVDAGIIKGQGTAAIVAKATAKVPTLTANNVSTMRVKQGVGEGVKIAHVGNGFTKQDETSQKDWAKNHHVGNATGYDETQDKLNTKQNNIKSGGIAGQVLATGATLTGGTDAGMRVQAGTGEIKDNIVEAVTEFAKHPWENIKETNRVTGAAPILLNDQHPAMAEKIKSTVGGRLGAKDE